MIDYLAEMNLGTSHRRADLPGRNVWRLQDTLMRDICVGGILHRALFPARRGIFRSEDIYSTKGAELY